MCCPTLGKACLLELSALMMRGNAVKQTTGHWGPMLLGAPLSVQAGPVAVLWDSGHLAEQIATAYPLKPCGTTAPVSLSEGDIGPP